jgi:hypothetical protein
MKELSAKAAAIIEAAQRHATADAGVRSRVWEQMQLRATAGDLGPELPEPAATTSIASTKLLGWIAAAAIGGGAVVAGVGLLHPGDGDPGSTAVVHDAVEQLEPDEPSQELDVVVEPAPEAVTVPDPTPEVQLEPGPVEAKPAKRRATPRQTTKPAAHPDDFTEEVELMGRARAALGRNDASQALALLEEHAKKFPRGTLGPERDASRIMALCALGRTQQAKTHATKFMRKHPRSALTARVRRTCVGDDLP